METIMKDGLKTAASALMSALFVIMVFAMMIVTLAGRDRTESYYENRKLATFPSFTAEGVADGSYFEAVGTFIKDHAAARETLIAANTYADIYLLRRPVVNEIYVGDDILLPYFAHEVVDDGQIEAEAALAAERFAAKRDLVEELGGKYYFVAVPSQYVCYGDSYPDYLSSREEYLTAVKESFMSELEVRGVYSIDMMDRYESLGRPDYFSSKVDHHFGIMGAYQTYLEVMEHYMSETGEKPIVLDEGEYELRYLPNKYVGSRLRKIFGLWESSERLGIITPKETIPFVRIDNGKTVSPTLFSLPETEDEDVLYTAYMGGDVAHTVIDTGREELPTILIYGESFTNAIETIAWYSFGEMHSVDLRHYKGDFEELLREVCPDIVVCVRDYSVLLLTEGYGH